MNIKIDRQYIINILEQYISDQKSIQEISDFTFDTISSDEDLVDEEDHKLLIEIIVYLDNIDNGLFTFSKPQAKLLISILELTSNVEISIELVQIAKFMDRIVRLLDELESTRNKKHFNDEIKKFGLNNKTSFCIIDYVNINSGNKLKKIIEKGNASALELVISGN